MKSFFIAISMYSKIPMPQFEWKEKDMRYTMIFFPFVGLIITLLSQLCILVNNQIFKMLFIPFIALFVSGGIHLDGFMDTMDGLSSYKSKDEKLKILSDPHIGAFSVITLIIYGLLLFSLLSFFNDTMLCLYSFQFLIAREFSALQVLNLKCAKENGTLNIFKTNSTRKISNIFVVIEILLSFIVLYKISVYSLILLFSAIMFLVYYRYKIYKSFGGITGDTSGWFVVMFELIQTIVLSIIHLGGLI